MYIGVLNLKGPKCFKNDPRKWESCLQSVKCRQARNMRNSTSPSKCRNTNFSNETPERILMSRVQLLMPYLAMTTQKELCKVGLLGFFSFSFLTLTWLSHAAWKKAAECYLGASVECQLRIKDATSCSASPIPASPARVLCFLWKLNRVNAGSIWQDHCLNRDGHRHKQ